MKSMHNIIKNRQVLPDRERGVVVGIDVSKRKIDFGAFRADQCSNIFTARQDSTGMQIFQDFINSLELQNYEPWIAFEPTGPYSTCLREWLISSGRRVVQVNPYHVKRTKEVRDNSPGKTDSKDPSVIADLVWQGCYQELVSMDGVYADLRAASVEWASLTKKRTAFRNEFQGLLAVWFPEITDIFKDTTCRSVRAIIDKYSDVEVLAKSRLSSVESTLKKGSRGRTVSKAKSILDAAKSSMAPKSGQVSRRNMMLNLIDLIVLVEKRQECLLIEMQKFLALLSETQYMLSIPGVGTITVAGLLGECGNIGKYNSYEQIEKFLGLNLYEVSSGKHKGKKHISKRGRALARSLICNIALMQIKSSGLYEKLGKEMKAKGKKTGEIRVALARKLLKVLYAIARDCRVFDPQLFFTGAQAENGQVIHQGTQPQAA